LARPVRDPSPKRSITIFQSQAAIAVITGGGIWRA
jgi:hypothetical protein